MWQEYNLKIFKPTLKIQSTNVLLSKEENKYGEKQMKNWAENRNLVFKTFWYFGSLNYYLLSSFSFNLRLQEEKEQKNKTKSVSWCMNVPD